MSQPRRSGIYYIVEHPTKGILRSVDTLKNDNRYSKTARRNSPTVMRFTDLRRAIEIADRYREYHGRNVKQTILQIRRAPDFKLRCWDCGGWLSTKFGREIGHRQDCPHVGGGD